MALKSQETGQRGDYQKFALIDGDHPLKQADTGAYVSYHARRRKGGKVRYFNFDLAKEMGLIPSGHASKLTSNLEKTLLDTFALVIINEYDVMMKRRFRPEEILPKTYMATRYLQLQHDDKTGRTSGDGRSVWNGQVKHKGKKWDISSCGTGATCLSPAVSKYGKFFETGDPSISYGCGYAELDEAMSAALFSEIFYRNRIKTERTLCVIEFEKGIAIHVRAHECLLRPSHLFSPLKQSDLPRLKNLVDFYIKDYTQICSELGKNVGKNHYKAFLTQICHSFAVMAADFEDEYIFCWLDWDGDNILMDGSIIDYGSVRQFGLFHHEYRYDDIERYSTTILEQKNMARKIVMTFAQMTDYLIKSKKENLRNFENDKTLKEFSRIFECRKNENLLVKMGFSRDDAKTICAENALVVQSFRKSFSYFERAKSSEGLKEVSDGVTWDAIFCMRDLMRELPQLYLARGQSIGQQEFIDILKSNYAKQEDLKIGNYRKKKIEAFQRDYWSLVKLYAGRRGKSVEKVLLEMSMRSSLVNKVDRATGDAIALIVDLVISKRNKLDVSDVDKVFRAFVAHQSIEPGSHESTKVSDADMKIVKKMNDISLERREGL